jgi:RNase H-fold protein (predicted Holliday junction resolvase)
MIRPVVRLGGAVNNQQGKKAIGDYPLHVICRDPHVSLQAIFLVVARHVGAVTTMSGGQEEGLYPFQIAAVTNADLSVIFYLLKRCPDTLVQFRLLAISDPVSTTGSASRGSEDKNKIVGRMSLEDCIALQDENESLRVEKAAARAERDAIQAEKDATVKSLQAEMALLQQTLAAAAAAAAVAAAGRP